MRTQIEGKIPWFGAIFAAVYAALYTRFASQWSYLANLYNLIKQASISDSDSINEERMAEWKAAFIEDAEFLHLSHKENFTSIIHAWAKDALVEEKYCMYTPGGKARFDHMVKGISRRYDEVCKYRSSIV